MPSDPNKLSQFWQELKRRGVVKVMTMYVASAFIIMEAADIMLPRLGLPDWTVTLVIILLIVASPILAILSWIFDITPEGLTKTESVDGLPEEGPSSKSFKRKLKSSDLIIAALVIIVGILIYPKVFKSKARLNSMTIPVTVVNEFGEKEIRKRFRDHYITRLAIFPFVNESKDPIEDWLRYGIFEAIGEELQQFDYLSLGWNEDAVHFQEKIRYAEINNYPRFLTGAYKVEGNEYEINIQIHQTVNGKMLSESFYRGSDFFGLIDSLSHQIRTDLGIPKNQINSLPDLPGKELLTKNIDAFRYFVKAYYHETNYVDSFYTYLQRAIDLDSTFALALYSRAAYNHLFQYSNETAKRDISQAMRHRHRLSEVREISTRILYYLIHEENDKAIALLEWQYKLKTKNIQLLNELIDVYERNFMIHKSEAITRQLNKLLPGQPRFQIKLARSYLFTGKLDKGLKVLKKLLNENPENSDALMQMGQIYLHKNDLDAAEKAFQTAIMLSPEKDELWSKILDHMDYIRNNPVSNASLEPFVSNYRWESSELEISISIHNNYLLGKGLNQYASFRYPVADNQFISYPNFSTYTFVKDAWGDVIKFIHEARNSPGESVAWKEDSLILKAKSVFYDGKHAEALFAFQKAYGQNPEHFYLTHYIRHLELVLGPEYDALEPVLDSYLGEYIDLTLFKEGNQYYWEDRFGWIDRILPISEELFLVPSYGFAQIHILKEKEAVVGLNFVRPNGDESFYPKISEQALAGKGN